MKGQNDGNEKYYYLVEETKLHDEEYFVKYNNDISPNR